MDRIDFSRRSFLLSGAAFSSTLFASSFYSEFDANSVNAAETSGNHIPAADLSKIGLDAFSDEELDLPYYVAHFSKIANSVIMEGKDRGFISIPVWRSAKDNKPYNARIMENILSLAFFYVSSRPWNPYYDDPRLRERLETALIFWCDSCKGGKFREYSETGYNLAATAFSTKFMGETLALLSAGKPKVDQELFERVKRTTRNAILTVFSDPELLKHGKIFSNQFTNAYAGGLAFAAIFKDEDVRKRTEETVYAHAADFQSPIGYFYEKNGPDWSYNLGTHHSNLRMCWFYSKGTSLGKHFLEEERQYVDWLSYNAVLEPNDQLFVLNKEVETRQNMGAWPGYTVSKNGNHSTILLESGGVAAAFLPTVSDHTVWQKKTREQLRKNWPQVDVMPEGVFTAFSPYRFLHRRDNVPIPTDEQKADAINELPYRKRNRFTQQRTDPRKKAIFTFIRRPGYYLIFNSGEKVSPQQRLGIGLIWTEKYGAILQSQREEEQIWGTQPEKKKSVIESNSLPADFFSAEKILELNIGIQELPSESFSIRYSLGKKAEKQLLFSDHAINITVIQPGKFTEYLPILIRSEEAVRQEERILLIEKDGMEIRVESQSASLGTLLKKPVQVGEKSLYVLPIEATNRLEYSFTFK